MMVRRNSYSVSEAAGEAHLDLLKAHLQQQAVELQFLLQVHGGDEGLVPSRRSTLHHWGAG